MDWARVLAYITGTVDEEFEHTTSQGLPACPRDHLRSSVSWRRRILLVVALLDKKARGSPRMKPVVDSRERLG